MRQDRIFAGGVEVTVDRPKVTAIRRIESPDLGMA
jgi:hypothetical protein